MKKFSRSGIMMVVIAVLLSISGGYVAASVPAVNPQIFVIIPRATIVQNILNLFNSHHNTDADSVLSAGEVIEYSGIMSTVNKINFRIEQLINTPKLATLNDDELVEYKNTVEIKAIVQLLDEGVINYKEIEAQLRSLYEQGSDEYGDELLHFIEQLKR